MASKKLLIQIVRGLIGDKQAYHNPLFFTDEELEDEIRLAIFRHNKSYDIATLPDDEMTMVAYRCSIDLCHQLAATNAPFSTFSIEGMDINKTGVMNNWLTLSDRYKDFYLTEMTGGLGAEGRIQVSELTRFSKTTGREVPYYRVYPFIPTVLTLTSVISGVVTITWGNIREIGFYAYVVERRTDPSTDAWTEAGSIYDSLDNSFSETLTSGTYDYRIKFLKGVTQERTNPWPLSFSNFEYLQSFSNIVSVTV